MNRILGLCAIVGLMIPIAGFSDNSSYQYQYQYQASYPTGQVVIVESGDSDSDSQVTNVRNIRIEIDTTRIISTVDGQELAYLDLESAPYSIMADRMEVSIDTIQNSDIQIIRVKVDQTSDVRSENYVPPVGFSDNIY